MRSIEAKPHTNNPYSPLSTFGGKSTPACRQAGKATPSDSRAKILPFVNRGTTPSEIPPLAVVVSFCFPLILTPEFLNALCFNARKTFFKI
jgi:hypothetical protein